MELGKKQKVYYIPIPNQVMQSRQQVRHGWREDGLQSWCPDDPTYMCWEKMKLLDLLGQYMISQPFPADLMWMKLHQTEVVSICYQELDWRDVSLSPRCASSGVNGKLWMMRRFYNWWFDSISAALEKQNTYTFFPIFSWSLGRWETPIVFHWGFSWAGGKRSLCWALPNYVSMPGALL